MTYAYEHFKRALLMEDMAWRAGPKPGQEMPDFDLPTTDGDRLRKRDFVGVRPLLLTFGSVTCPMTAAAGPKLKHLHARFGDRVGFATLYVREAHPGDRYPQPDTLERKLQFARALKERDGLPWPVAVELHRKLDAKPNACYVMDTGGRVAFRALWSNDREEVIGRALEDVLAGRSPVGERNGRILPMMRGLAHIDEILERSGPSARRDLRHQAPPMYALAKLAGLARRGHRTAA